MSGNNRDEILWRYLGGHPATSGFSHQVASDPSLARRLAELALVECSLRDEGVKAAGRRLVQRRLWMPFVATACVALVALVVSSGIWLAQRPPSGSPVAADPSTEARELAASIREGKAVRVREKPFRMGFAGERTELVFAPGSEVKVEEIEGGGRRVRLDAGRLDADLSAQEDSLEVQTPHLTARVVGTRFGVEVQADGSRVAVAEGVVEVASPSLEQPKRLSAGQGWWQLAADRGVSAATISRVAEAPAIDGEIDALWDRQPVHSAAFPGDGRNMQIDSEADHSTRWRAVWDDEALYVLIEMTDNADGRGNENPWSNDSAEIFVDAGHERAAQLDGVDDYLLFFDPSRPDIVPGIGSVGAKPEMTHATRRTGNGLLAEVRLPWDSLGRRPGSGDSIGFNVATNDTDETNGNRRSQLTWTPKGPGDFGRPDRMGVLTLSGSSP